MQQTATTIEVVHREIRIDAPPSAVFEFLTDPAKMVRWMGTEAVLDPRPGGDYAVNINGHERVSGEVIEVVPDRRLVFTWGFTNPEIDVRPGASTVEVSFEESGNGTRVRLTHRDLPATERADHDGGWRGMLERLATAVTGTEER